MKSNQYVYPSKPFSFKKTSSNALASAKIESVAAADVIRYAARAPKLKVDPKGKTIAHKVLSIFLSSDVLFGPRQFIADEAKAWIEKFNYFISKNKPLQFAVLGFPFKMAVPLKTDRTLPDMGEVLALMRLANLAKAIQKVYRPGAVITVFTEGGFAPFVGISEKDAAKYDRAVRSWCAVLGISEIIKVRKLGDMEKLPGFKKLFAENCKQFQSRLEAGDASTIAKRDAVLIPVKKIVSTKGIPESVLVEAYDERAADDAVTLAAREVRRDIDARARESIVRYFSYLKTRDDLGYVEKVIPHYLALSVSPKPGRLGVIPVDRSVDVLPYHGVPVWDSKKKRWSIRYLIELAQSKTAYVKMTLKGDPDKAPFFYRM